ncbi:MAG: DNA polymerase III subunit gamma/tau [Massiliimalia sp.]|jgi:DNA polymerase-3 subunit gamma/tau
MYLALYRKWRPKTFDDVISQEPITTTLRNQVKNQTTAHSYLFTGSRGTGKTTCAKILAMAVNCLHPVDGSPCMECEICRGIDDGSILDVLEIDAASNNGVDDVRMLREEANYTPAQCRYRVYIIDETHMLSVSAFNALLKIMEEPPPHVKFILATTEVHKVPATVLSRCQRFDFGKIRTEDIAKRLLYISEQESFTLEPEAAHLIARLADGGMRDALSMLDQCIAYSQQVDTQIVAQATGLILRDYLFELTSHICAGESGAVLEQIEKLYTGSKDLQKLVEELMEHFRNLMIVKTVADCQELVHCLPEELERLKEQSGKISMEMILRCIRVLQECGDQISRDYDKRLSVEMALLKLCSPEFDNSSEALLARIESLERQLKKLSSGQVLAAAPVSSQPAERAEQPSVPAAEPKPIQTAKPAPERETKPPEEKTSQSSAFEQTGSAGAGTTPQMLGIWPEILGVLQEQDPALAGILAGSIAYAAGDNLFIDSPNSLFSSMIKRENFVKTLLSTLEERTGIRYRLRIKKNKPVQKQVSPLDEIAETAQTLGIPVEEQP